MTASSTAIDPTLAWAPAPPHWTPASPFRVGHLTPPPPPSRPRSAAVEPSPASLTTQIDSPHRGRPFETVADLRRGRVRRRRRRQLRRRVSHFSGHFPASQRPDSDGQHPHHAPRPPLFRSRPAVSSGAPPLPFSGDGHRRPPVDPFTRGRARDRARLTMSVCPRPPARLPVCPPNPRPCPPARQTHLPIYPSRPASPGRPICPPDLFTHDRVRAAPASRPVSDPVCPPSRPSPIRSEPTRPGLNRPDPV